MRFFLDCEFNDTGSVIDLISIGMVAEDGRELYLISSEFDEALSTDWVRREVLPRLEPRGSGPWRTRAQIRDQVLRFVGNDHPAFWAYAGAFDFVAMVQLVGPLTSVPSTWPFFIRDVKQLAEFLGVTDLPPQGSDPHNALHDARYARDLHHFLVSGTGMADRRG